MFKFKLLNGIFLSLWALLSSAQQEELLPPDQAFAFSTNVVASNLLEVNWRIAKDYYMYRDKFQVRVLEGDVQLGELQIPHGGMKTDEFFGQMEINTDRVAIGVPVLNAGKLPLDITIEAGGQGCNDPIGVCYPPLRKIAKLTIPAKSQNSEIAIGESIKVASLDTESLALQSAVSPGSLLVAADQPKSSAAVSGEQSNALNSVDTLRSLLGDTMVQSEFLDPEVAFRIDLQLKNPRTALATFFIEDGYYLYRDKTGFESQAEGIRISNVSLPEGISKTDSYFGEQVVYYTGMNVEIPLVRPQQAIEAKIKVNYQGCAEQGICYPPMDKVFTLNLPGISEAQASSLASGNTIPSSADPDSSPSQRVAWPILLAFAAGLALTFTPCVLPMIPILASIVVGQGGGKSKSRGGLLSIVYVLGTAVTYTAVGVVAGKTGDQLQSYFQNPWGIGVVVVILVLLSLSMFGLYEIQMPASMQSKLMGRAGRLKGGVIGGVFFMGLISALIVGACVSPVLIAVLGLAIERADPVLGGMIMFSLALGSGVVLVAIGFGAAFLLPKAGPWMDVVKYAFGVMLLGVAIYILGALPVVPVLYLWGTLLIVTAVYLGALQSLPEGVSGWRYLWKGLGVFSLVWGIVALIGGMSGGRDILRPIQWSDTTLVAATTTGSKPQDQKTHGLFTRVSEMAELDSMLMQAKADGRPVMLDYYADWCVDCVRMEKITFTQPQVRQGLNDFVMIQVDLTDARNEATIDIKKRYQVYGPPAMLFFDRNGSEIKTLRRYGFMGPDEFINHIKNI